MPPGKIALFSMISCLALSPDNMLPVAREELGRVSLAILAQASEKPVTAHANDISI